MYYNNFVIQKKYGFLRQTSLSFLIRSFLISPIIDTLRFTLLTLICMVIFNYGLKLPMAAFVVIIVAACTIICILDIAISGKLLSCTRGKMTPLEDKDPELL